MLKAKKVGMLKNKFLLLVLCVGIAVNIGAADLSPRIHQSTGCTLKNTLLTVVIGTLVATGLLSGIASTGDTWFCIDADARKSDCTPVVPFLVVRTQPSLGIIMNPLNNSWYSSDKQGAPIGFYTEHIALQQVAGIVQECKGHYKCQFIEGKSGTGECVRLAATSTKKS